MVAVDATLKVLNGATLETLETPLETSGLVPA